MAYQIVLDSPDFKPKWTAAVEWLSDELERVKYFISNTMVQFGLVYSGVQAEKTSQIKIYCYARARLKNTRI